MPTSTISDLRFTYGGSRRNTTGNMPYLKESKTQKKNTSKAEQNALLAFTEDEDLTIFLANESSPW